MRVLSCKACLLLSCVLGIVAILLAAMLSPMVAPKAMTAARPGLVERALAVKDHQGNPCKRRGDGRWCVFDVAVECIDGRVANTTPCKPYEKCSESSGQASCLEDACGDKPDGRHCRDDHVVTCSGNRTVHSKQCKFHQDCALTTGPAECTEGICDRKIDGSYCYNGHVVQCKDQKTVNGTIEKCAVTQECVNVTRDGGSSAAACVEKDCHLKPDGTYCMHGGVVKCSGGVTVGRVYKCPFYQMCDTLGSTTAVCRERVCHDKVSDNGWHCSRHHLVQCINGRTVDVELCPMYTECEKDLYMLHKRLCV